MKAFQKLLLENKAWAQEKKADDPEYFLRLAQVQTPKFLWIGCSDSRVPANEITGTQPGEIFVHRNIANLVIHTDINLMSVLEYAIAHLKVEHVIVCGHYGCGGIKAAESNQDYKQVLNMWLRHIKDVYALHRRELDGLHDEEPRLNRLTELNVQEQVMHLSRTSIVQKAWSQGQKLQLHGWVYGLKDGIIQPILDMDRAVREDSPYAYQRVD